MRSLRQSFPRLDAASRARVIAEVALRVLSFILPEKGGPLTFDKLIGKR